MAATKYKDVNGVWRTIPTWDAANTHFHGNISNDGKIGEVGNRILGTIEGGQIVAKHPLDIGMVSDSVALGGMEPGNELGQIPVNNEELNVGLNADLLDGYHRTRFPSHSEYLDSYTNMLTDSGWERSISTAAASESYLYYIGKVNLKPYTTYTIAGEYRTTENAKSPQVFIHHPTPSMGQHYEWLPSVLEYTPFSYTFTTGANGGLYQVRMDNEGSTNGQTATVWYKDVHIEEGEGGLPYTPGIGDNRTGSNYPVFRYIGTPGDYHEIFVATCLLDNNLITRNSWSVGELIASRFNGLHLPHVYQLISQKLYNDLNFAHRVATWGNTDVQIFGKCMVRYLGNYYGGFRIYTSAAQSAYYWKGVGTFLPFVITLRNVSSGAVVNAEAWNSLTTLT